MAPPILYIKKGIHWWSVSLSVLCMLAYLIQAKCVFHASKSPTVPIFGKERIIFRCCWILIDECFHDFVRLWLCCCARSWLAIKVPVLCPKRSFTATKGWKVLSCFWLCRCSSSWCFHDFIFLGCWMFWLILAIVISVVCPLHSFTTTKGWKVLPDFWFCCCSVVRCSHDIWILILLLLVVFWITYNYKTRDIWFCYSTMQ